MKVAIVHDWLSVYGGSERVVEEIHVLFPKAPIYTSVYDADNMPERFKSYDIRTTFLQKIPFAKKKYPNFLPLMPRAFEALDLTEYDLVISSSTSCSKGVITRSDAVHICYCNTPMRYAWEFYYDYVKNMNPIKRLVVGYFMHHIRMWDRLAADRVDYFVANSNYIKQRIEKYYKRKAEVIFPPVNTHLYHLEKKEGFYLIVSRFVPYKRVDLAVEAFNELGLPLIVIGTGSEEKRIRALAKDNIRFLGRLSDEDISSYYARAKAFIFPGEEDFGLTPIEAQASGTPVIAYGRGGALDTVVDGKSGVFFKEQTKEELIKAIKAFENHKVAWSSEEIKAYSEKFSVDTFKESLITFIKNKLKEDEKWSD